LNLISSNPNINKQAIIDAYLDYFNAYLHPEGIVVNSSGSFEYNYYLNDHLGNTRITFTPNGTNGEVKQVASYYPFGMRHTPATADVTYNRYLYNGKEQQSKNFGPGAMFDWYDYGARFYDPTLGRWHVIDPWAESYYSISPYVYGLNNPIRFIDPNGKGVYDPTKITKAAEETVEKIKKEDGNSSAQCSKGVREAFKKITGSKEMEKMNANEIGKHMESSENFAKVSLGEVQELVNSGVLVIASQVVDGVDDNGEPLSGHVALAVPGKEHESGKGYWGQMVPQVMDTGEGKRHSKKPLSYSWKGEDKDKVNYYRYNAPSADNETQTSSRPDTKTHSWIRGSWGALKLKKKNN
jgi:RHS repeat-associated protein